MVDLKAVRDVANKPTVVAEQVWRDMLNEMADEIEQLRKGVQVNCPECGEYMVTFDLPCKNCGHFLAMKDLGGNDGNE